MAYTPKFAQSSDVLYLVNMGMPAGAAYKQVFGNTDGRPSMSDVLADVGKMKTYKKPKIVCTMTLAELVR